MNAQWNAPISDRLSSLCARVFSPAAAKKLVESVFTTYLEDLREVQRDNLHPPNLESLYEDQYSVSLPLIQVTRNKAITYSYTI